MAKNKTRFLTVKTFVFDGTRVNKKMENEAQNTPQILWEFINGEPYQEVSVTNDELKEAVGKFWLDSKNWEEAIEKRTEHLKLAFMANGIYLCYEKDSQTIPLIRSLYLTDLQDLINEEHPKHISQNKISVVFLN